MGKVSALASRTLCGGIEGHPVLAVARTSEDGSDPVSWLNEQMPVWAEILFGFLMLFLGLYLEDKIDTYRAKRSHKKRHG